MSYTELGFLHSSMKQPMQTNQRLINEAFQGKINFSESSWNIYFNARLDKNQWRQQLGNLGLFLRRRLAS